MLQIIKMAFRDLGRNRRRSFFSALALAIGLALLLFMAAFIEGEMRSSLDSSIKLQSGHLQVRAGSYNEDKTSLAWEDLLENPETLAAQIASLEPVSVATPRLYASGVVTAGDRSTGVRIVGIDPSSAANAPFRDGMVNGEFLQADDRSGILIGQTLADKLKLNSGDSVNLLSNTSSGDVDEQSFIIRGIFSTKTPGFDESTVFLPLTKAQAITRTEKHASTIFVLLKDKAQTAAVLGALQTSQYQVKTWEQMNLLMVQMEDMVNSYMVFIYLIVLAITATVIVNTLIMSVFERTREIGILSALGMKGARIMALFFAESSLLALMGIAMGLAMGGILCAWVGKVGLFIGDFGMTGMLIGERIYTYLTLEDTVSLVVIAFIVSLLAALYPALLAARMEPVTALRGGK